jgi:DNA repair protein RecO (recombination protein O)
LHLRPYRETSAIVSLLTLHHGRVAVVGRGIRGNKRGNALQPFSRIRASWSGRASLGTLTGYDVESSGTPGPKALPAGFYVLELITRLVGEHESVPAIYAGACWCLDRLVLCDRPADVALRCFEKLLLEELGYGLDFRQEAETGEPISAGEHYRYWQDSGFRRVDEPEEGTYPGFALLQIEDETYGSRESRIAGRRLFREALAPLLGPRPLASRQLLSGRGQRV